MKPSLLLVWFLSLHPALGTAAPSCGDLQDVDSINRVLACEAQSGIFSCAGIGLGLGGTWLLRQDAAKSAPALIRPRTQMLASEKLAVTTNLAAQAHADWLAATLRPVPKDSEGAYQKFLARNIHPKADPNKVKFYKMLMSAKPPRYWPQVEEIDGTFHDVANTPFRNLPPTYQEKYLAKTRAIVDSVFDRGLSGGQFDTAFLARMEQDIHTRYYQALAPSSPAAVKAGNLHPLVAASKMKDSFCGDCTGKAIKAYESALAAVSESSQIPTELQSLRKFGPAATFLAARVSRAEIANSLGTLSTAPVGCGGDPVTGNIATDENCKTLIGLDQRVLAFLQKPPAEQAAILTANPVVCDFYRDLNIKLSGGHKFTAVSCGAGSYSFTTQSHGQPRVHQVTVNSQGEIEKLRVQFSDSIFGPMADFTVKDGMLTANAVKDVPPAQVLELQRELKLYLPASLGCCSKPPVEDLKVICNGGADNGFNQGPTPSNSPGGYRSY